MRKFLLILVLYGMNAVAQPWQEVIQMAPDEAAMSDFGVITVFADAYLVVSWPKAFSLTPEAEGCGEVITYKKNGGQYEEINRLTAADLVGECVSGDGFGFGLAYDQGRLAIGMPAGARSGVNLPGGATDEDSRVFITSFSNGNWQLEETLIADDLGAGRGMGFYLAMEDNLLLVHAHEYDSIFGIGFVESTGVYVFEDEGNGFIQQQKLTEDHRFFGQDFDTENGQIIIGAWGEQDIGTAGKIFIYEKNTENWSLVQTINDPDNRNLGNQIEIIGDTMIAGSVNAGRVGAVKVFNKTQNGWQESQLIEASDKAVNDQFGIALKMTEDELVVGASAGTNQIQTIGAVYYFTKNADGQFIEQQKIESPLQNEASDQFGSTLIFNETDLLVSEPSGRILEGSITNFWHYNRESTVTPEPNINQRTSGVWQVAGIEGQSMNLEIINNNTALMYLNYSNLNGSSWLFSIGEITENQIIFSQLYVASGPLFGDQFNPEDLNIEITGQANFRVESCESGTLSLNFANQETQEFNVTKTFGVSSLDCENRNKSLENGISGSWYNPNRDGEGFSVYTHGLDSGQTASVHWYTYDQLGNPVIYIGQGNVIESRIEVTELKKYGSASLFSTSGDPMTVGGLNIEWQDCANARFSYDLEPIGFGSGTHSLIQLTRVKDSNCQQP